MKRVSWDEHALILAYGATCRSQDPFKKVGACALGYDNHVLGVAYNGLAPGKDVPIDFWSCREKRRPYILHAEVNLLSRISRDQIKIFASTLLPCSTCALNIAAHGVERVVYSEDYEYDSKGLDILKFYGIKVVKIPKEKIIKHIQSI
jgi:dCMP deaminase